ncbi:MAG TPA: hypothetical protein VJ870_01500, partial [Amycolatopsis sp.]|nr:hypothetical protein [Amycolatopsis sp.]
MRADVPSTGGSARAAQPAARTAARRAGVELPRLGGASPREEAGVPCDAASGPAAGTAHGA